MNSLSLPIFKSMVRTGLVVAKLLVAFSILFFLYNSVFTAGFKPEEWFTDLLAAFKRGDTFWIASAVILIPVNYGLEAWKWQRLASKVEPISFSSAFRAVLLGMSLGFITPNRVGDYAGRIMEMKTRKRLEAIGAVFLGRFCQLGITTLAGSIGVLYFLIFYSHLSLSILSGIILIMAVLNGLFGLILFYPAIIIGFINALPLIRKLVKYIQVTTTFSFKEITTLLQISFGRYLIFIAQFMLLLQAFGVQVTWWQMAFGVAATFLLKSIVPSFNALSDLGMRELSAMYFFSILHQDKVLVMSASLSLWFLNIALPTLVGLLFIWQLKFKNLVNSEK